MINENLKNKKNFQNQMQNYQVFENQNQFNNFKDMNDQMRVSNFNQNEYVQNLRKHMPNQKMDTNQGVFIPKYETQTHNRKPNHFNPNLHNMNNNHNRRAYQSQKMYTPKNINRQEFDSQYGNYINEDYSQDQNYGMHEQNNFQNNPNNCMIYNNGTTNIGNPTTLNTTNLQYPVNLHMNMNFNVNYNYPNLASLS